MKIQSYSLQGKRPSNEDQHYHHINMDNREKTLNPVNFVGVFDGHGGKMVSKYLKKQLPKYFLSKINKKIFHDTRTTTKYIKTVFNGVQDKLSSTHPRASSYSGSTACCGVHLIDKNKKPILWTINVGDSRAILCKKNNEPLQLTQDHKPNSDKESKRISKLGGKIYYDGYDWRIKDLSLSRAFGDNEAKPYVSHLPEISRYKLNKKDKFVIFACDGLWDVVSNKKAVDFVLNMKSKNYKGNYAKKLAQYAINEGSTDNVTVVLLFL